MSFFGKLKQGLGIGTAGIELDVPTSVGKDEARVSGTLVITAKSDQTLKSARIRLTETHTKGSGESKKVREYILGEVTLSETVDLKQDERKEMEFVLPFSLKQSGMQQMADKGGALGVLGKAAVLASSEKSEFFVRAVADLDGVALDPTDVKRIQLT